MKKKKNNFYSPEEVVSLPAFQERMTKLQLASLDDFMKRLNTFDPKVPKNYRRAWTSSELKRFRELVSSKTDNTVGHIPKNDHTKTNRGVFGFAVSKRGYYRSWE